VIDLPLLMAAMDKIRLGLPHTPLPMSDAKRRQERQRQLALALCFAALLRRALFSRHS
jgi:hypothetical protein